MKIHVTHIEEPLLLKFVPDYDRMRLWIRSLDSFYPTYGWCPHIRLSAHDCADCGLVLEDEL